MYEFEVPPSIKRNLYLYYRTYFWFHDDDAQSIVHQCRKTLMVWFYIAFTASIGIGGQIIADAEQRVFVSLMSVLASVNSYRVWLVMFKKTAMLKCINEIGIYHTNDEEIFNRLNDSMKLFMKFGDLFTHGTNGGIFFATFVYPILKRSGGERSLFFSNAFVLDYTASDVSYLAANIFVILGMFQSSVVCSTTVPIVWYLLLSLVFRYRILKHQLNDLGSAFVTGDGPNGQPTTQPIRVYQRLFMKDLLTQMKHYNKVNRLVVEFASTFSDLFFLQTMTSAVCLCGSLYNLAFSSHIDYTQYVGCSVIMGYILFDIFMIMYLGNEIMMGSDALSYCLYQSNWLNLTESNKKCILILMERLKRRQKIILGKLYPLDLTTFTSIMKGTYSVFNLLQSLRH